jgi:diguanylate cyclase (GGDEF)-like protein
LAKARENSNHPSNVARAEEIQHQIQQLSGRDFQLWSIVILMLLVLTGGIVALILPNILWMRHLFEIDRVEGRYIPQLFFGLISLIVLFNIYLIGQKRAMGQTRRALIHELVLNERLENLSLIDPLTQLLNHRAMNEFIPREVARANRLGSGLTFMAIELNNMSTISSKHGVLEWDAVVLDFARLLKDVFRGADIVFRSSADKFLVALPETSEQQADPPIHRLTRGVEQWNLTNRKDYELSFAWAIAPYVIGSDYADVLRALDRKMYGRKHNLLPVF